LGRTHLAGIVAPAIINRSQTAWPCHLSRVHLLAVSPSRRLLKRLNRSQIRPEIVESYCVLSTDPVSLQASTSERFW